MILTGRSVVLIGLGAAGTALTLNPWVMVAWTAAVITAAVVDWLFLPTLLTTDRSPIPAIRLSHAHAHNVRLTNSSRRRIRGTVRDSWQPSAGAASALHEVDLAPGQRATVTTVLHPTRRGQLHGYRIVLRARSRAGLAWRQSSHPAPALLRVLPEFKARRHLPSRLARLRELDGQTSLLVRGEGTEFDSLREYVDGDDVRSLDWRASARRHELVVRTWRPERDRRVLIVLDTSRLAAARLDDETRLDAGIETTLLMAALASRAGDRVEVIALDRQIRAQVKESKGESTMAALADALGPLEAELTEPDWPVVTQAVNARLTGRALVVLCTAIDPGALGSGLVTAARAMTHRHNVIVASATDPTEAQLQRGRGGVDDVYIAAAASRAAADRIQLSHALSSAGVQVIEAEPDRLAPQVADRYLGLKAAGKL